MYLERTEGKWPRGKQPEQAEQVTMVTPGSKLSFP